MTLGELHSLFPGWTLGVVAVVFGLLWGSFLNVVIYRVPREMSVVRPASHCPGCGKPIAAYDNIPVLAYVILRGRARCCGARMSPRYPLVELIGGLLSLAVLETVVAPLPGSTRLGIACALYASWFSLSLGLVAAAFIDAEHMFLPDSITLGGLALGVATAWLRDLDAPVLQTMLDSAKSAFVAFFVLWFPFTFLYKGLLGRTGMGLGDAKLMALAGAWFGWRGALFVLFAGAIQGSLYALALKILGVEPKLPDAVLADIAELEKAAAEGDEEAKRELEADPLTEEEDAFLVRWFETYVLRRPPEGPALAEIEEREQEQEQPARHKIPFGPFLILAALELLFAGRWIDDRLRVFFGALLG